MMKRPEQIDEMLEFRREHLNPMMSISYNPLPIYVKKSEGQYFYDQDDRKLLDCINNVSHVGHCNPVYVERISRQFGILNTNSRFLYDVLNNATQKLLSLFPPELCVVTWANSGSEANDLAIQMARIHTGNEGIVCLDGGYHGHTEVTMKISPYKWNKNYKKPKEVIIAKSPCTYRGEYFDQENSSALYARDLRKQLLRKPKVACYIAESMQSCGGQVVPNQDFLKEIYQVIKEKGGVCIADEVQTGMGRLGNHFWAFEYYGVTPDIVTVGKALGNGYPVSAVICTKQISDTFAKRNIEYFNTYGANPVACTAAEAVIDIVRQEKLQENAKEVGTYLNGKFKELLRFPQVGDIRGMGFFQGIDVVESKESRKPDSKMALRIRQEVRRRGVLISVDGPHNNVLKFKPPMVFNKENADTLIETLTSVLEMITAENTNSENGNGLHEKVNRDQCLNGKTNGIHRPEENGVNGIHREFEASAEH
jgi:ethanolamine-phosphate phospho-lyase